MAKFALFLAATLLCATPALAQDLMPQPGKTEPVRPSAPMPPRGARPASTPLPGLVVQAPKLKPCGYRDKACQADVIEEIWKRYPDKVQEWCAGIVTRRARERLNMQDLLGGGSAISQTAGANFDTSLPEPERTICMAHGKRPEPEHPFVGAAHAAASTAAATKAAPRTGACAK